MQSIIIAVVREVAKLAMFTLLWGFPMYLVRITGVYSFLWLLLASAFFTFVMFLHYEALEYMDNVTNIEQNNDEENIRES